MQMPVISALPRFKNWGTREVGGLVCGDEDGGNEDGGETGSDDDERLRGHS